MQMVLKYWGCMFGWNVLVMAMVALAAQISDLFVLRRPLPVPLSVLQRERAERVHGGVSNRRVARRLPLIPHQLPGFCLQDSR
jgi:hypothetical protein